MRKVKPYHLCGWPGGSRNTAVRAASVSFHARNHALIRAQLAALLRQYPRVVVLGGSHDGTLNTWEDIEFLHQQAAHIVPLAHVRQAGMDLHATRALQRATQEGPPS